MGVRRSWSFLIPQKKAQLFFVLDDKDVQAALQKAFGDRAFFRRPQMMHTEPGFSGYQSALGSFSITDVHQGYRILPYTICVKGRIGSYGLGSIIKLEYGVEITSANLTGRFAHALQFAALVVFCVGLEYTSDYRAAIVTSSVELGVLAAVGAVRFTFADHYNRVHREVCRALKRAVIRAPGT